MRIAREGLFKVSTDGTTYTRNDNCIADNGVIVVEGETNDDVRGFSRRNGGNIVIGTDIRKLIAVDDERLTIEKGIYAKPEAIVYPIGYTANLKTWDAEQCKYVYTEPERFELELSTIMPDKYKKDESISDRLVFECSLDDSTTFKVKNVYNNFELQICWDYSANAVSQRIAGRINIIEEKT